MDDAAPSPVSGDPSLPDDSSAPSSPTGFDADAFSEGQKKPSRKKRKPQTDEEKQEKLAKKQAKKRKQKDTMGEDGRKKPRKQQRRTAGGENLSAAQLAVNEQMRRVLEDDAYSALGSIVDTDTDDDDIEFPTRGGTVRLDHGAIVTAMKKRIWMERQSGNQSSLRAPEEDPRFATNIAAGAAKDSGNPTTKTSKTSKRKPPPVTRRKEPEEEVARSETSGDGDDEMLLERDEGSIFGQTTGASNATWVECDKCKKWRRLRGVVDEKKLPTKWYCSMNKNDPERARCSAPEEEYEAAVTPESAADARIRKHLRVWVRRLESNENYEARQPTMTRGKKRNAAHSAKEPYEWVRCCNPSCGKWRAVLRCMDAKQHVLDRAPDGEWFCVMNTWDEKLASCAAPQENLPAIGCPPWVMQDDN